MEPASIVYLEIPAPEPKRSAEFYQSLFGWDVSSSNLTDKQYWIFRCGEGQLMGAFDSTKVVSSDGVILYIKVDDIERALAKINSQGGETISGRSEIGGGFGYSAMFRDPNGNTIGLWAKE
ncbi:MAG: VOC family protein [Bacteriovoracaceae bacterium]|jgi:uncharacterized protein|nr:VOC family protein [Bacteriovoracaceae bacterium]